MDYGVYSRHSACLRTISARCQIQSTPRIVTRLRRKGTKYFVTDHNHLTIFLLESLVFQKKCVLLCNISRHSVFFIIKMYALL